MTPCYVVLSWGRVGGSCRRLSVRLSVRVRGACNTGEAENSLFVVLSMRSSDAGCKFAKTTVSTSPIFTKFGTDVLSRTHYQLSRA